MNAADVAIQAEVRRVLSEFEQRDTQTVCPLWLTWGGVLRYRGDYVGYSEMYGARREMRRAA